MRKHDSLEVQALMRLLQEADQETRAKSGVTDGDAVLALIEHARKTPMFPVDHYDDWWRVASGVRLGQIRFRTDQEMFRTIVEADDCRHQLSAPSRRAEVQ